MIKILNSALCILLIASLYASVEAAPATDMPSSPELVKQKTCDPFIAVIAKTLKQDEKEIQRLHRLGYGRNELIKLILISSEANKNLRDIVKLRAKAKKLASICDSFKLDYGKILSRTADIRKKIDEIMINTRSAIQNSPSSVTSPGTK